MLVSRVLVTPSPSRRVAIAASSSRPISSRSPWRTTTRPSTTTWVTSAARGGEDGGVLVGAGAGGARRGGVEGDQVGARRRPRSRRRRRSRGSRARRCRRPSSSAAVQWPRCWVAQPLVELDGAHLLEQVDHGVAVGAEGERAPGVVQRAAGADAVAEVALGGRAEAGVWSAAPPSRRDVVVGEVGGVHGGRARAEQRPRRRAAAVGVTPYAAQAGVVLGDLLGEVDVQRAAGGGLGDGARAGRAAPRAPSGSPRRRGRRPGPRGRPARAPAPPRRPRRRRRSAPARPRPARRSRC